LAFEEATGIRLKRSDAGRAKPATAGPKPDRGGNGGRISAMAYYVVLIATGAE